MGPRKTCHGLELQLEVMGTADPDPTRFGIILTCEGAEAGARAQSTITATDTNEDKWLNLRMYIKGTTRPSVAVMGRHQRHFRPHSWPCLAYIDWEILGILLDNPEPSNTE